MWKTHTYGFGTHTYVYHPRVSVFGACSWEADFVLIIPLLKCKQVHEEKNYLYDRKM